MDLVKLGVVIDPSGANTGASEFKSVLTAMAGAANSMQAAVTAAAKKAGVDLAQAGTAGQDAGGKIKKGATDGTDGVTKLDEAVKRAKSNMEGLGGSLTRILEFAGGGLLQELISGSLEKALDIPKEVIATGLEYNDVIERTKISIAGMMESQRPEQVRDWNQAIQVSAQVVDELQKKVQQYHFNSLDTLQDSFRAISTGTSTWGLTLNQQIDLASKLLSTMRAMNVDGQQASRDMIDLLMGRGERIVAAKEILAPFGGVEKFNDILAKVHDGTAKASELVDMLNQASHTYAEASEHGNEVLSTSFEAFKQQLAQALGSETSPLYKTMVDSLAQVRQVLQFGNFDAMKPFIADLQVAVGLARDLAIALLIDPQKFGDGLMAILKWAFSAGVDELVTLMPKIVPVLIDAFKAIAPVMIDIMFEAAAILTTAVQSVFAQINAKTRLIQDDAAVGVATANVGAATAGRATFGLMGPNVSDDVYNSMIAKRDAAIQSRDSDRQLADGGYNPSQIAQYTENQYQQNRANSSQLKDQFETSLGMDAPKQGLTEQTTSQLWNAVQDWRKGIQDEAATALARSKADQIAADNAKKNFVGPVQPSALDVAGHVEAGQPTKGDYLAQVSDSILEDKIKQNDAIATGNEKLIEQAKQQLQIDEFRKQALSDIQEKSKQALSAADWDHVNEMAARYATSLKAANDRLSDQKDILKDINVAEEQATAARTRLSTIQQNPFMSQLAKRPELIASYDVEISKLQEVIRLNQEAISSGKLKDQAAVAARQKEIDKANQEIVQAQVGKSLQTDGGVFTQDMAKFMDSLGNAGSRAANIITGTLNTAISSTSDNIMKVIQGTETWGQAFQKIGLDIMNTLEQLVIKMLLMQALQAGMGAAGVGSGAGLFGGMMSGFHTGGVVGQDGASFYRSLPRFHTGGVADDESLAVVKKDESILTPAQMKAISGGKDQADSSRTPVHIHITNLSDPSAAVAHLRRNPDQLMNILGQNPTQTRMALGIR